MYILTDCGLLCAGPDKEVYHNHGDCPANQCPADLHHQDWWGLLFYLCVAVSAGSFTGKLPSQGNLVSTIPLPDMPIFRLFQFSSK